jgi:hypothetical protein
MCCQDVSLEAGLAVAIVLAWTLLGCRLLWWDGTNKMVRKHHSRGDDFTHHFFIIIKPGYHT